MTFWMKRLLEIPWLAQLEAPTRNDHHYSATVYRRRGKRRDRRGRHSGGHDAPLFRLIQIMAMAMQHPFTRQVVLPGAIIEWTIERRCVQNCSQHGGRKLVVFPNRLSSVGHAEPISYSNVAMRRNFPHR
jgi:hypothetical protein